MTGFGKSQLSDKGYQVICEIRGVNHRYLDISIRIPRRYIVLEDKIKEELKRFATRGRLEINLSVEKTDESVRNIKLDKDLAMAYHKYLKDLAENLQISPEINVIDIFRLPDVFNLQDGEEDMETVWEILQEAIATAMSDLVAMRTREGKNLAEDILKRNEIILGIVGELEEKSPNASREYTEKLSMKIKELIGSEVIDEQRILMEAAIFAEKTNITEEIVRLKSHISHLDELLLSDESVGRKCDFLVQEMFREINTIAAKANDLDMSRMTVDAKAELEKMREQLQNIE